MNKTFYISAWILGSVLLSFVIHGAIEIPVIFLFINYKQAMLGLSWKTWELIHNILSVLLFFGFVWLGLFFGKKYWRRLYEK